MNQFFDHIRVKILKMAVYQPSGHIELVVGHSDKKILIDLEKKVKT